VQHVLCLGALERADALAVEEERQPLLAVLAGEGPRGQPDAVGAAAAGHIEEDAAKVVQLLALAHALLAERAHDDDGAGVRVDQAMNDTHPSFVMHFKSPIVILRYDYQ
jgi:hypothetical protein